MFFTIRLMYKLYKFELHSVIEWFVLNQDIEKRNIDGICVIAILEYESNVLQVLVDLSLLPHLLGEGSARMCLLVDFVSNLTEKNFKRLGKEGLVEVW